MPEKTEKKREFRVERPVTTYEVLKKLAVQGSLDRQQYKALKQIEKLLRAVYLSPEQLKQLVSTKIRENR